MALRVSADTISFEEFQPMPTLNSVLKQWGLV